MTCSQFPVEFFLFFSVGGPEQLVLHAFRAGVFLARP